MSKAHRAVPVSRSPDKAKHRSDKAKKEERRREKDGANQKVMGKLEKLKSEGKLPAGTSGKDKIRIADKLAQEKKLDKMAEGKSQARKTSAADKKKIADKLAKGKLDVTVRTKLAHRAFKSTPGTMPSSTTDAKLVADNVQKNSDQAKFQNNRDATMKVMDKLAKLKAEGKLENGPATAQDQATPADRTLVASPDHVPPRDQSAPADRAATTPADRSPSADRNDSADRALATDRSPEAARNFARQALEIFAETLSGVKLDFDRTDAKIDLRAIKSLIEAFAQRSNATGQSAEGAPQVGLPPPVPTAASDASKASRPGDWTKPTGVPVMPMVAESDVGLSDIRSIGRQIGRWTKLEASTQQWAADLPRFILGLPTTGQRVDTTAILTVGGESFKVGFGPVTVTADGALADLETQQADVVQLTGGPLTLSIWNDTRHKTDQSVYTGGGKADVDTSRWKITVGDYKLDMVSLGFRVGTGIPDRSQTELVDGHRQYKPEGIKYADASKGHLILSGKFLGPGGREIELTGVLSSGDLQHLIQSKLLHTRVVGVPEFPNTHEMGGFVNAAFKF